MSHNNLLKSQRLKVSYTLVSPVYYKTQECSSFKEFHLHTSLKQSKILEGHHIWSKTVQFIIIVNDNKSSRQLHIEALSSRKPKFTLFANRCAFLILCLQNYSLFWRCYYFVNYRALRNDQTNVVKSENIASSRRQTILFCLIFLKLNCLFRFFFITMQKLFIVLIFFMNDQGHIFSFVNRNVLLYYV